MIPFSNEHFVQASGQIVDKYSAFMENYIQEVYGTNMNPPPDENPPIYTMLGNIVNEIFHQVKRSLLTGNTVTIPNMVTDVTWTGVDVEVTRGNVQGYISFSDTLDLP